MKPTLIFVLCVFVSSCIIITVNSTPLVIGHRGFPLVAPENTMPSFEMAMLHGVDGIETDLRLTKDNVLVTLHDETLDRTTNCTGYLSDYTWEELQDCDASNNMSGFAGTKIPLFVDVIEFARNHSLFIVMDYKSPIMYGQILADIIANMTNYDEQQQADIRSNLIGSCWNTAQEQDIEANLAGSPIQTLTNGVDWVAEGYWTSLLATKTRGFSIRFTNTTQAFVQNAHKRLLSVTVWTPVTSADLKTVISWNVDGIITDDCVTLRNILNEPTPGHDTEPTEVGVAGWVVALIVVCVFAITTVAAGAVGHYVTKRSYYKAIGY